MSGRDDLPKVSEILQMERKDLQSLSRANGLPANLKNVELIDQLVELAKSKRKKKDKNEEIEEKEKRKKKRKNSETSASSEEVSKKRKKVKQEEKPKKKKHKKVEDMELDLEEEPNQESDLDFAPSERSVKKTGKGDGRASEKAGKFSDKRNEEKKEPTGKRKKEKEEESSEVLEKKEKRSKEKEGKSKNEKEVDNEKGRKSKIEKEGSDNDEKGSKGKSDVETKGEKARKSKMELEVDNTEKGRKSKMEKPVKSDKEGQEKVKDDNADKGRKINNDRVTKNDDINEKSRKSKNEKEGAESVQGFKSKNDSEKKSEISSTKDKKPEIEKKKDPDFEDTLKKDTPRETEKKKDTSKETGKRKDTAPQETEKKKETPRETDKRKESPQETAKKEDISRETDNRKDTIPKEPEKKKDTLPQETDKKKDNEEIKKMTDKVKSNEIANVVSNEKPALQKSTLSESKKIALETNNESGKGITNTTIESPPPKYPLYNTVVSYGKILAVLYEQFCISSRCIQFLNEITGKFLCKISKSISMINELSMDILKDTLKKAFIEGDLLEEIVTEIQNSDQRYNDPKYFSLPLQNRAGLLLDLDQMHQFLFSFKVEVPRKVELCLGVIMECMVTRIFIKSLPKPVKKGFLLTENHVRSSIQADTTLSRIFKEFLEAVKPFNESLPIREYLMERKLKPDPPPAEDLARLKSKLGYSIPSSLETFLKFIDGKIELGVDPCQKIEANLESRPFLNDIFPMVGWLPIYTPSIDIITCLDIDSGYVLQLDILHLNTSFVKVISKNFLQYIQTIEKHVKPEQGTPIESHDPIIVQLLNPVLPKS